MPPSSVTGSIRLMRELNDMRDGKMRTRTLGDGSKKVILTFQSHLYTKKNPVFRYHVRGPF